MFLEQFSFHDLVIFNSIVTELLGNLIDDVFRIYNIYCPLRTKQYSTHRLLNTCLTYEIIRFLKFKHFLVSQVKGNNLLKYIPYRFKQELRKQIDASKKHITPANSQFIKIILKKPWMILQTHLK